MAFDPELWTEQSTALAVVKAAKTSPAKTANTAAGYAAVTSAWDGKVTIPDAYVLRHWARNSEWIRGAIGIRKSQVAGADWDVVPFDQTQRHSATAQKTLRNLLRRPNAANDSWRSWIEPIIEDLITLDAGCIEIERDMAGRVLALWPVDGAKIKVNALWDGDPNEARYFWYPDGWQEQARFKNDDFIYMMKNRRTDSPIGWSDLQTLRATIEAEMTAHEYNRRQVAGAAPDGVLNLGEGMTETQARQFASYFESEVAGRGAIGFLAGVKNPSWIPFRDNNREMQFLEWQIYLVRKICVVMGLTPQDLGLTFDVNRSTAETQIQISEDRGLRPLMTLIQEYITQEIVWDPSFGGQANNLAFRFTALNLRESTAKADIFKTALGGVPWRFVNEARIDEGREPIPEMEGKLIMATPQGAVNIMDVPTVRELADMQLASRQQNQQKPPAAQNDLVDLVNQLAAKLNPQPLLGEGAINVKVDNAPPAVHVPVTIEKGAVHIDEGAVKVDQSTNSFDAPLTLTEYPLDVAEGAIQIVNQLPPEPEPEPVPEPPKTKLRRTVLRDQQGRVTGVRDDLVTASGAVAKSTSRLVVRDEHGHITEVTEE